MKIRYESSLNALLFAIASLGLFGQSAQSADFENLWTKGHGDLSIHYEGNGELHLGYELGDNAVVNGAALGTVTEVDADTLTTVIPDAAYAKFIGGVAGLPGVFGNQTFWYISQPNPGEVDVVPWLGIGAEEIASGLFVGNTIGLTLKSIVSSPADSDFILYRSTLGSPSVFIDTQNLGTSNFVSVTAETHGHYYFGFSKPGTYQLEFEASGDLVGGGTASGSAIYAFNVVPEPSTWITASLSLMAVGITHRWRKRSSAVVA